MSDSITPFGTTRSIFSLATNDLEINGDITASKFIGSGEKLTKITSTLTFDDSKARTAFGWEPTSVIKGIKLKNNV